MSTLLPIELSCGVGLNSEVREETDVGNLTVSHHPLMAQKPRSSRASLLSIMLSHSSVGSVFVFPCGQL